MAGVQKHIVTDDENGQRADRWFFKNFPDIPKSHIFKCMRKGQIRVDSKRIKPDARLESGQEIRIPPLSSKASSGPKKLPVSDEDKAYFKSLVLYEDDDVIAINKPAGLAVQGGTGIKRHLDAFLHVFDSDEGVTPRLVHRLDRQTSGVMLLARSAQAARFLGRKLKDRDVKKIYWAICSPTPIEREGEIKASLAKGEGTDKEKIYVDPKGKRAHTSFSVIDSAGKDLAFVAFWPHTGRTHQIRVHASLLETEILGDDRYGDEQNFAEIFADKPDIEKRLYLHAHRIVCPKPSGEGVIDVVAPLDHVSRKLWEFIGFDANYTQDPFE